MSLAIHWARYFSCLCQRNERVDVPDEYIQKALYLNLPYDNIKRLHYAYEGFDPGVFIFCYTRLWNWDYYFTCATSICFGIKLYEYFA